MCRALALVALGFALLVVSGCATSNRLASEAPPAPREFRAAWVATVANIDWPSRPSLPVAQQRAEIIAILDRARALNLNAIILQVRPSADALYLSALEPWSEYLTGEQGRAPAPFYDPLQTWVDEAHRRGLELHAWFNPYRARHHEAKSPVSATHLSQTHPAAVKTYGAALWMDPAEPIAVERTLAVIRDVVRRYNIDGVHIDDYFYPYPIATPLAAKAKPGSEASKATVEFPDEPAWQRYRASGGQLARADWRRSHVDHLVAQMYRAIHEIKPWVRFGISPFGIGRPDRRPPGIAGFSQYDDLYANVELWLERGWLDYLVPQLYWPAERTAQSFPVLLDYWAKQNPHQRHLWPGLFTSSINDTPKSWRPEEIPNQIALARAHPAASGHAHFSMIALLQDRQGIATQLARGVYVQPALVPATPWLGQSTLAAPQLQRASSVRVLVRAPQNATLLAIWFRHGNHWRFHTQPAQENSISLSAGDAHGPVDAVVVSAVDRLGHESPRTTLLLNSTRRSP